MSALEIVANVVNLISVLFASRNSIHTWWSGIIGCFLFGALFYQAKLYADVTLQIFFIGTSAYGWRLYFVVALVIAFVYSRILIATTDASLPFADSIVLIFSVLAQFLLMRRKLENWAAWLIVNTVAIPVFLVKGLYLTAGLYGFFWVNAWLGLWTWLRIYRSTREAV